MRGLWRIGLVFGWLALSPCGGPALGQTEDSNDYFDGWLNRDVVYIISGEERDVFGKLTTDDERSRFVEEFWRRRDPNPDTPVNEYRDEHYRRIAYANEKFAAGKPGWKTDRGMIYIKFGPPDRRQTNPMGGRVYRTQQELLASAGARPEQHMTALPFEVWEYRKLEGLGEEVAFEFVAKEGGVDYKLALDPDEKDALFFNTGSHLPEMRDRRRGLKMFQSSQLDRLERLSAALRPLPYEPPEEFVAARVHFSELPFEIQTAVEQSDGEAICQIRVLVPHSSLSFNRRLDLYQAEVDLQIFLRDVRKVVVAHRSDRLVAALTPDELRREARGSSQYETRFTLPPGRYLVEVWIKDAVAGAASFDSALVVTAERGVAAQP